MATRGGSLESIAAHLGAGWHSIVPASWRDGWRAERFELDGGWTEVVTLGSGPAVALMPPLPGFKEAWIASAAGLARRFRVVTFDLRSRFPGRPNWDTLLADADRILDALAPGAIGVVGHSLGGALAQRWALARPDRVRALVLSSTFARVTHPRGNRWARFVEQPVVLAGQRLLPDGLARPLARRLARREAWVYDTRCDDAVLDFVRYCIRRVPLGVVRSSLELVFAHDTRAALRSAGASALIVIGERESVFVREAADELRRLLPGAEFAVSPGAGHLHPLSNADWLVTTLTDWLHPRLGA